MSKAPLIVCAVAVPLVISRDYRMGCASLTVSIALGIYLLCAALFIVLWGALTSMNDE